jgi:hypothetical protein
MQRQTTTSNRPTTRRARRACGDGRTARRDGDGRRGPRQPEPLLSAGGPDYVPFVVVARTRVLEAVTRDPFLDG